MIKNDIVSTESTNTTERNITEQMVDAIIGKEKPDESEREKEIRQQLSSRACEYLMFMGDE